jgi:hypothetical protein
LAENARTEWDTIESKLAERNIDIDVFVLACFSDLLCEGFELSIEVSTTSSFLLLSLEFFFVAISILPLPVSGLVELDVGSFSIELNILCLLLADQNWVLQMDMDDDYQFMLARLEEEMLDVAEENIDSMLCVQG